MKRGGELRRKAPLVARTPLRRSGMLARSLASDGANQGKYPGPPGADLRDYETARPGQKRCRETGFPASVKLAVRKRAGNGEADDAACEACGRWLGRYGGEVQHIQARGSGGSRKRNKITNAVLLCGPSTDKRTCHGKCEARDEHMRAMGFWLRQSDKPQQIMLHGSDGGVSVWLAPDGTYSTTVPAGAA